MPPPPPPPPPSDQVTMEANNNYNAQETEATTLTVTMNVINTVTQLLLGAVAFSAFFFANGFNGTASLKQHIYLCVIGYVIMMSQAILTFSPHNGLANSLKYPDKKIIHWVMQVIGSILAITGSIIRLTNMTSNLQTTHGALGLVAMILTSVSLVGGVANLVAPQKFSSVFFRTLHIVIGALTISVAFVCLCLGFDNLYRFFSGDVNANLSISITVIALVGVLASTVLQLSKRFKRR